MKNSNNIFFTPNQKELELLQIISNLDLQLIGLDLGVPLSEVYKKAKARGIYQSDRFIGEKLRKFAQMGFIRVENWNITAVDKPLINEKLAQRNLE